MNMIGDPYSKYLTKQELLNELYSNVKDSFLGIGAVVDLRSNRSKLVLKI